MKIPILRMGRGCLSVYVQGAPGVRYYGAPPPLPAHAFPQPLPDRPASGSLFLTHHLKYKFVVTRDRGVGIRDSLPGDR